MYPASFGSEGPYGPFVKTGRGGAGNFTWKQDVDEETRQQKVSDPEAQIHQIAHSQSLEHEGNDSQYLPTGRGGAGNYMSASEKGAASDQASPIQSAKPTVFSGRGGAGNFESNPANGKDTAEKDAAQALQRIVLEKQLQRDVELGLKRPEEAHIPVPEGREIGS